MADIEGYPLLEFWKENKHHFGNNDADAIQHFLMFLSHAGGLEFLNRKYYGSYSNRSVFVEEQCKKGIESLKERMGKSYYITGSVFDNPEELEDSWFNAGLPLYCSIHLAETSKSHIFLATAMRKCHLAPYDFAVPAKNTTTTKQEKLK